MKKQTKKLIAAGIVMALSCGVWGSAQAEDIQYKLDAVPGTDIFVNEKPNIPTIDVILGIDGSKGNNTQSISKINQVDVGIYAANDNTEERHSASDMANNIEIIANHQEKNTLTGTFQAGVYARKNGDVVVGGMDTESVVIRAINKYAYLNGLSPEKINKVETGRYKLLYYTGAAYGLYTNTSARYGKANIDVNGKKIEIVADALGTSYGVKASANSMVQVGSDETEAVSITTDGSMANGIDNTGSTNVKGNDIAITAKSKLAGYGVLTANKANTNIGTEKTTKISLNVNGGGTGVYGVCTKGDAASKLQAKTVSVDVNNNSKSSSATGFSTAGDTNIIAEDAELNVSGELNAYGIEFSTSKGNLSIQATNKLMINVNGKANGGTAITGSYGKVNLIADVLDISAKGKTANVVNAQKNAIVELGKGANNVSLTAIGAEEAYVIQDYKNPANIKIGEDAKNINITSEAGKIAHGISLANGSNLTMGGADTDISIKAHSSGETIGILDMQEFNGKTGGSVTNINGKSLSIDAVSDTNDSIGIHVQNSSTTADDNKATVNVNTENTVINAKTALSAMSQGVLNVNSNLVTHGENAILTRGNSDVNINTDGKHTTQLNGDIVFDYSDTTGVDSNVNVNLSGADSSWTGNTKVTWESQSERPDEEKLEVSGMKLNVANGAQWNPVSIQNSEEQTKGTKEVALNQLHLDNGVVNLDSAKLDEESVVSVQNISGTGTINTNAFGNMMEVENKEKGTTLTVHGTGTMADEILADTTGEKAKMLAATVSTPDDKYASDKITTDAGVISGAISADVDENGNLSNYTRAINPSNQAISNMATISLMTWRQENNDMNKRLGELRASQGSQGVWARMARGQAKYGEQSIKNQYNYYQLGYDSKISDDWILGGAFTYTDGESSYTNGSGTNKHTGFAIYGSNLRDDGSFIDIIAKYAHMKNDFDVNGGVGTGDYSTNGYSFSAEYGKRFHQEGFWIEPQAELTYGKVSSADFTTKNGASVHQDSMDSLVGRLGFSLGKDIKQGNVYVRASYLYDFQGDTNVRMSLGDASTPFKTDLGGGWWEFGVGTNLNLGHDTHFYLDVETTAGGDVDTPWQWNAGVRFSF